MKQELRLIVTQACNYDCYFCHHEGIDGIKKQQLNSTDIKYLYYTANKYFDINTVTITGGEPLILNEIEDIVRGLYELGCQTTIVTNGSLLSKRMNIGKYIEKLNISLHSLEEKEYERIVGRKGTFNNVIANIKEFRALYPDVEININYALINDDNTVERVHKIINFAKENNINVKFIELFPKNSKDYLPLEELHKILLDSGHMLLSEGKRKSKFSNGDKSYVYTTKCLCSRALDFPSPSAFCHQNNDLFIAQDGSIKLCRLKNEEIVILDDIKHKDEVSLSKKLKLSFDNLGHNCPYEK